MFSKKLFSKALIIAASLFSSFFANASLTPVGNLIQVSTLIQVNNDCGGYFGSGNSCKITHVPTLNSPVFANLMEKTDNPNFNMGSDWTFDVGGSTDQPHPSNSGTGQWNYTGNEYPGVSYWVAKASNSFVLNWMVANNIANSSTCTSSGEFSIDCLSLAVSVTTGTWTTPLTAGNGNSPIIPRGLSHISFYGNKCDNNCGGGPPASVPEPSSIALFALALLGISARRNKFTS